MGDRPIVAVPSGTKATVMAFARDQGALRLDDVELFVKEIFRLGTQLGWDAFRICVQSALETNNWRSPHWESRLNPGAIGVTDSWDQGLGWKDGTESARVMLVHTAAYVLGSLPDILAPYKSLDPRFDGVLQAGFGGKVKDFGDYGKGKWASDPNYSTAQRSRETWMHQFDTPDTSSASPTGADLARVCAAQVGKPYVWAAAGPNAFDCSGLVMWGAAQLGKSISHDSHEQFKLGTAVDKAKLAPGDVLFYDTQGGAERRGGNTASHVGVYISAGKMVNALNPSQGVILSDPFSPYFAPLFLGARRLFPVASGPALPPPKHEGPDDDKPKKIELDFPLYQTIIPRGQTNQRPGTKQVPSNVVCHETANYNAGAGAKMHSNWLLGGAQGGAETKVSVHFFVDDHEAFQMLPLDEVSYNAGCGSCAGNYGGVSIELCVNSDGDYEKARRNAALLAAWVLQQIEEDVDEYKMHQAWSGKNCPALILQRGLWPNQQQLVTSFLGGNAHVGPHFVDPSPIDGWDGLKDITINGALFHGELRTVTAAKRGDVHQWASFDSALTRDKLKVGETFPVFGWVNGEERDGEKRWWVTQSYSRVWVGDTKEKPGTVTQPSQPDQPDNPDLPDVPSLPKILNGRRVYIVGQGEGEVVHVTATELPVRAYADPAATAVRVLHQGDSFTARYWLIGMPIENEPVYWVLDSGEVVWSGGTDERPS
jgi:cell wall-associated NlpC family hydrolase